MSNTWKTHLIHYRYDALDRLASHVELNNPECQRFYCDSRLVTEIEGSERLSIVQHGDQLLAQQQRQSSDISSTLLATDLQRSVFNALQASLQQTTAYSPYGHRSSANGLLSLLGFNGQKLDPVTGHYLLGNGYRSFNPVLMRFNSPDNLSPFDKGGLNAYAYCAGDPVNRNDSTGHFFSAVATAFTKVKARYLSFVSGEHVKPVKNFTRISEGLVVFVDRYKGGPRLNIYGHGAEIGGVLKEKNILLGPKGLSDHIKSTGFQFESFDSARLLTCHSGNGFIHELNPSAAPFGQLFSDYSGLPVKAYKGTFLGGGVTSRIHQLKVGETSARIEYFRIDKNPESKPSKLFDVVYDPVSFQPTKHKQNLRTK
ncbi:MULTISPECIES: RHS repeat-associated core domain-containing protein [unclassified Pseudomonas]|uniref:RHS repeat-associated core domain-containing protein n=1 Tax=unclassified Pseudomonas TaxID=196821 RepID=UPI001CBAFFF0|nr:MULTISPECIES: RHS repeat-associated core domain-containing protein [unclassified Pseudomonas]MBI3908328.1 RHS repeat-associated core domain-containing protein [Pseudomonas fluorescens]